MSTPQSVAEIVRRALRDHAQRTTSCIAMSDVDTSKEQSPCFWITVDGQEYIVEVTKWEVA